MRVVTDIAEYQGVVGTTFELLDGGSPAQLFLLKEVKAGQDTAALLSFSLFFSAPPPLRPQKTYLFRHERLGELHIFLVPLGPLPTGFEYHAAFSQLKTPPSVSS